MVVNISTEVLERIEEYSNALTYYPIRTQRAHEKVDDLISALISLGNSISTPPICTHKDLGQIIDASGNPMDKNLRRFNYKDKSGFQWAFACYYDWDEETITVTKMIAAIHVKESIEQLRYRISKIINEEINKAITECERLV